MKTLKTFMLLLIGLLPISLAACSDSDDKDVLITESQLPATSATFVKAHFPDAKITSIKKDVDKKKVEYDVYLANGFELTFDEAGEWTDVDAPDGMTIPSGIAPLSIVDFIESYYPAQGINEISRYTRGYEVELTNGLDLLFDTTGNIVRIGD